MEGKKFDSDIAGQTGSYSVRADCHVICAWPQAVECGRTSLRCLPLQCDARARRFGGERHPVPGSEKIKYAPHNKHNYSHSAHYRHNSRTSGLSRGRAWYCLAPPMAESRQGSRPAADSIAAPQAAAASATQMRPDLPSAEQTRFLTPQAREKSDRKGMRAKAAEASPCRPIGTGPEQRWAQGRHRHGGLRFRAG